MSKTESRFLKVKCGKCKNEQIIFSRPSTEINCIVCDNALAKPTGSEANIKAKVLSEME